MQSLRCLQIGFAYSDTEGATLKGTVFNLINTVIGAGLTIRGRDKSDTKFSLLMANFAHFSSLGILALPYTVRLDGILTGIVLILFVAVISQGTMWMLVGLRPIIIFYFS